MKLKLINHQIKKAEGLSPLILLLTAALSLNAFGAFEKRFSSALSSSMVAGKATSPDFWGINRSPATISRSPVTGFSFTGYRLEEFQELVDLEGEVIFRVADHGIYAAGSTFGWDEYRESIGKAGHSFLILPWVHFGYAISFMTLLIPNNSFNYVWTVDAGLFFQVTEHFGVGFKGENLNASFATIPRLGLGIEMQLALGIELRPWPGVTINAEMEKNVNDDELILALGQEFWVLPFLALRAGAKTRPLQGGVGLGLKLLDFRVDYGINLTDAPSLTNILTLSFGLPHEITRARFDQAEEQKDLRININSASALEIADGLKLPRNICDALIRYREDQRPFRRDAQLLEIEGIDKEILEQIKEKITYGSFALKGALQWLNSATAPQFQKEGLDESAAKAIVNYRAEKGFIDDVKKLKSVLAEDSYIKLRNIYFNHEKAGKRNTHTSNGK